MLKQMTNGRERPWGLFLDTDQQQYDPPRFPWTPILWSLAGFSLAVLMCAAWLKFGR